MKNLKLITVGIVMAMAVFSMAQGQGRGGGRMQMGRGGGKASLLRRNDVIADLKLTDQQKDALDTLRQAQQAKMGEMFGGGGPGRGGGMQNMTDEERKAMMDKMQALQKENEAAVQKILTETQWKRLDEIRIQVEGDRIIMDKEYQTKLKMTEAQIKKVQSLRDDMQAAMDSLRQKMRDGEIDREGMMEAMDKNNKVLVEELGKVLTKAQKDQLKAMAGAKFEADPEEANPRGGFGRGGGGR